MKTVMLSAIVTFALALLIPAGAHGLVLHDDENIEYVRGEPICMDEIRARRFESDFKLNQELDARTRIEGSWCSGPLWQLMWSLAYLDEMKNSVRAPSSWINGLYGWFKRRVLLINYLWRRSDNANRSIAQNRTNSAPDKQEVVVFPRFFNMDNPVNRMALLVHEARHSDAAGGYYLHVTCTRGAFNGVAGGCDATYQPSRGGAYSFLIYIYAWIYYNGLDEQVSPAMKDWAKNTANAYLESRFNSDPDYRLR